ncbi:MAG: hypothetical protein Q9217_005481 [Psora testacea]
MDSPPLDWAALEVAYREMTDLQENESNTSADFPLAEMGSGAIPRRNSTIAALSSPSIAALDNNTNAHSYGLITLSVPEKARNVENDEAVQVLQAGVDLAVAPNDFGFDIDEVTLDSVIAMPIDMNIDFDRDFEDYVATLEDAVALSDQSTQAMDFGVYGSSLQRLYHSSANFEVGYRSNRSTKAPAPEGPGPALLGPDLSWMDASNPQQPVEGGQQLCLSQFLSADGHNPSGPDSGSQGLQPSQSPKQSRYQSTGETTAQNAVPRARRFVGISIPYEPHPAYVSKPLCKPTEASTDIDRVNRTYERNILYTSLAAPPRPWDCFRYNISGELDPSQLYTPTEITRYLFTHPLHYGQSTQDSPLKIWIQRNPSQSRNRYPSTYSHRCRFITCPLPTINQGHYCVAFVEQTQVNQDHDPFISAGYVHLWCLERFCDLPKVFAELNISPDTRSLPLERKGRNPMRLVTLAEEQAVDLFKACCRSGSLPSSYPRYDQESRPHTGTLTHTLAVIKIQKEPKSVSIQRIKRFQEAGYAGSTLTTHQGDLEVEASLRSKTRLHKNQNQLKEVLQRRREYFERDGEEGNGSGEKQEDGEEEVEDVDGRRFEVKPETVSYAPPVTQIAHGHVLRSMTGMKHDLDANDAEDTLREPVQKRRITAANCATASHTRPSRAEKKARGE